MLALVIAMALAILLLQWKIVRGQEALAKLEASLSHEEERRLKALDFLCGIMRLFSFDPKQRLEKAFEEAGIALPEGYDFDPKMERSEPAVAYFSKRATE